MATRERLRVRRFGDGLRLTCDDTQRWEAAMNQPRRWTWIDRLASLSCAEILAALEAEAGAYLADESRYWVTASDQLWGQASPLARGIASALLGYQFAECSLDEGPEVIAHLAAAASIVDARVAEAARAID